MLEIKQGNGHRLTTNMCDHNSNKLFFNQLFSQLNSVSIHARLCSFLKRKTTPTSCFFHSYFFSFHTFLRSANIRDHLKMIRSPVKINLADFSNVFYFSTPSNVFVTWNIFPSILDRHFFHHPLSLANRIVTGWFAGKNFTFESRARHKARWY